MGAAATAAATGSPPTPQNAAFSPQPPIVSLDPGAKPGTLPPITAPMAGYVPVRSYAQQAAAYLRTRKGCSPRAGGWGMFNSRDDEVWICMTQGMHGWCCSGIPVGHADPWGQ